MDLGTWTSRTGLECIDMAEKICFITKEQNGTSREEQYISQVICHCGEDIMDKEKFLKNGNVVIFSLKNLRILLSGKILS